MNTKTFIICITTMAVWVSSITLTSVRTNVRPQQTTAQSYAATILVAFLGIMSMIVKTSMEFLKNAYLQWKAEQMVRVQEEENDKRPIVSSQELVQSP